MLAARAPAAAPRAPARATGGAPRAATPKTVPSVAGGPAVKLRTNVKNPRLRKVLEQVEKKAAEEKQHPPASQKAAEAQAAAQPPGNEKLAGAKAGQVGVMKEAPTGKPESNSFLDLLRAEIDKVMPKTLGDADNFMEGGQKDQLKGAVSGNVNQQSDAAASGIKGATSQAPDPSAVAGKEVTPMPAEGTPAPPAVNAGEGMPLPKTDAEISLQKSKQDVNQQMTDAEVTPEQLKKANDPRFSAVLTAKGAVEKQADAAPKQYRAGEAKTLSQAVAQAQVNAKTGLAAVRGHRAKSGTEVKSRQQLAKEKDEAARKAVADGIESIYNRTKQAVEGKLATLEPDVMALFDKGVDAALATMKDYVDARMGEYKSDRYDRIGGSLLWAKDKLFGMPDEVNVFIQEGRRRFTQSMDALIVRVANLVETRLQEAKTVVAKGEAEVHAFVLRQPKDLQGVAKEAEKAVGDRFRELEKGIDEKKNDLAQKLAQRYKEASDKADAMKQQMEEENKGLVSGFIEKLGAIIKALAEFKDKLMGLLRKGWETIKQIIADPIGFLGNLISAIKQGVTRFKDNIWTHLKAGFMQWLFGSLADAGITLPKDLSLPSILSLVLGILGLTYDRLRAKAVNLIGERNVKILEKLYEYVKTLITEGPAALWEKVKDDLSNLKAMVIDAIQDWIVTTIVKAAITKLVTMFNPAGAIIQAIIAIYNTVMFFIENASKIMALLEAVINSVSAIAMGDIGGAATWIEQALARTIPVIIGFLARLIGLGGISDKIREIIQKVQGFVDKAIDKVLAKIVALVKKLFGKGKDGKPDERSAEEKAKDLRDAVAKATPIARDERQSKRKKLQALKKIKEEYRLASLEIVIDQKGAKTRSHVRGSINPTYDGAGYITDDFPPEPKVVIYTELGPSAPRRLGFEEVLEPPGQAGLPGYHRAHLIGRGFGAESPLGIFYTTPAINLRFQNSRIEDFIRQMYVQRFPGARLFVRASSEPHPGTQILARVVYTLFGQLPGEPVVEMFEVKIVIKDASLRPRVKVLAGELDPEALGRYTSLIPARLAALF